MFQCDCGKDLNTTNYIYHYVHHKDLTVGLGDGKELKEKVIRWIQHSPDEERAGFGEVMLWKQMMLNERLDKFGAPDGLVDEFSPVCDVSAVMGAHSSNYKDTFLE